MELHTGVKTQESGPHSAQMAIMAAPAPELPRQRTACYARRGTARPLWLPNDPRDLTTRVAREERELGRLARAARLDCAR